MSVGFSKTSLVKIELPNIPEVVPYVVDDCSLSFQLGYRTKTLWWVINNKQDHYTVHRIPKKRRGFRIIHAPSKFMKAYLRRLHSKFLIPLQGQLGSHVTAYRKGLSTRHAVAQHIPPCKTCDNAKKGISPKKHDCPRKGTVIQMDLTDFFGSTHRSWIRNYFKETGYNHYTAGLLASLLTVDDLPRVFAGVPQGAPTSGAICNLIADWKIDHKILDYLKTLDIDMDLKKHWDWKYTRYSDDLCFTCGIDLSSQEKQEVCEHLTTIIQKEGYWINPLKTRVGHSFYRKTLLGMVFNQKPNIPREKYLLFRAMVHNALTHGIETQYTRAGYTEVQPYIDYLRGNVNYINQIIGKLNPERAERLQLELDVAISDWEASQNG
jgi:hypothetical protein